MMNSNPMFLGDLLYLLSKELKKTMEARLKNSPIGFSQLQVLMMIKRLNMEGAVTQESLTKSLDLDKSNVSRNIKKLEEQAYLTLQSDAQDSRKNLIELTPFAYEQLEAHSHILQEVSALMLTHILPDHLQITMASLQQALSTLKGGNSQ